MLVVFGGEGWGKAGARVLESWRAELGRGSWVFVAGRVEGRRLLVKTSVGKLEKGDGE